MFKILLFLAAIISVGLSQPVFKPQFSDETSYQQNHDSKGVTNYNSSLNSDNDYSIPDNVNTEDDSLGTNDNISTALDNLIKKFNEVLLGLQIQLYKVVDGIKSNIINVHFLLSPEKLSDDIEKNINNDDDDDDNNNDVKEILNNNENIPDQNQIVAEKEEQGKKEETNQENKEKTKQETEEEPKEEKEPKQDIKEEKQLENKEEKEEEAPLEKALKMFYEFMKYHAESEDEHKEENIIEDVKSTYINPELSSYEKSTSSESQSTHDTEENQSLYEANLLDINDNTSLNEKTDHSNEVEDGIFEDIGFSITKLWNELFG